MDCRGRQATRMRGGYLRGSLARPATQRPMDVLAAFVAAGGSVPDAAELVGIRPSTVKRHLADTWATELRALETARMRVETEYFEGTATLYPATVRRWTEQRELSDGLVELIARLAELDGTDPLPANDPKRSRGASASSSPTTSRWPGRRRSTRWATARERFGSRSAGSPRSSADIRSSVHTLTEAHERPATATR
jgi:hypothetical protein